MAASTTVNMSEKTLDKYQLGDCLGKGASAQVYRALNFTTGEAVAVKQIQLTNIPKSDLGDIKMEIDLLKKLNHPNIVKYKGFVTTREYLYIILEYCENGSLHNITKRFGKFPENLVAVYISQVLVGLVYLHEQGVIHRDIKGANLLTNKDGTVKLADFGVASKTAGVVDNAVVGSPYWMAPEVIEQSGATTASDIWSVGCVVIELLEGKPPYHNLNPMQALFRIVQDDCPPIPEGASPIVKDFLYHCFHKDGNLRVSAKKLLKHPWMVSARKQMNHPVTNPSDKDAPTDVKKPNPNYNFDEAVLKVQEWNEALKSPSRTVKHPASRRDSAAAASGRLSPSPSPTEARGAPAPIGGLIAGWKPQQTGFHKPTPSTSNFAEKTPKKTSALQQPEEVTDNWDDDFEEGISLSKLHAVDKTTSEEEKEKQEPEWNARTIRPLLRSASTSSTESFTKPPKTKKGESNIEDYSDLAGEEDDALLLEKVADFKKKTTKKKGLYHPNDIKTVGLGSTSPAPATSPLPNMSSSGSIAKRRPGLSPLTPPMAPSRSLSHSRSSSMMGGSMGRTDSKRSMSQAELQRYTENDDEEDYDELFGKPLDPKSGRLSQTLQLNTRLSNKSWPGEDNDNEEDPFAEIDEGFVEDDLETNLNRDKYARLCATVNQLIDELVPKAPGFTLRETCDQLIGIIADAPEMQMQLVSSHGMLAILEVLESNPSREVIMKLLQIINLLVTADIGFLESFCLIGGIPVLMGFTSKRYPPECRIQASNFIRLLCHTSVLTLQMFIACRGLKILVDLLDEDYHTQMDLVEHAVNGIASVFELQSPTPKNDFCRMFIREGLLDPLSSALINAANVKDDSTEIHARIASILLVFTQVSQSDTHVRTAIGTRQISRRLIRACELARPDVLVQLLKAVKHMSMSASLLEVLQNANALEILVKLLDEHSSGQYGTEVSNHIFQTCFNLCRLNKSRQEEAAQAGIIPHLKRILETNSPLKQFALPVLCDLASAGKSCRTLLWSEQCLGVYVRLLEDPYFQVSALEAILSWLQDEMARVEDYLLESSALHSLVEAVVIAKGTSFENLLEPLLKMLRLSSSLTAGIVQSPEKLRARLFHRMLEKVKGHSKAVVRLNLLKLMKLLLENELEKHDPSDTFADKYGIRNTVSRIIRKDTALLVREIARDILQILPPGAEPVSSISGIPQAYASGSGSGTPARSARDTSSIPRRTRSGSSPHQSRPQLRAATQPTPPPPLPSPLSPILLRSPSTPGRILVPKRKPRSGMNGMRRTSSETSAPLSPSSSNCSSPEPMPLLPGGSVGMALRTTGLAGSESESGLPIQIKPGNRQKLRDIPWNRP